MKQITLVGSCPYNNNIIRTGSHKSKHSGHNNYQGFVKALNCLKKRHDIVITKPSQAPEML